MAPVKESRILIVDDEPLVRITLSRILKNSGYKCLEAYDFHSALTALKNISFDLVIADINMPETSGLELLKTIKRKWAATCVIMMTGGAKTNTATDCMKTGASDFITKPIDLVKLTESIRQALQSSREPVAIPN